MNSFKVFIIMLVASVVFFGVGFYAAVAVKDCQCGIAAAGNENSFLSGWEAAKERLKSLGFYDTPDINDPLKEIEGKVTGLNNDKIQIELEAPLEMLADPALDKRIVKIEKTTKIIINTAKDEEIYRAEREAYDQIMEETSKKEEAIENQMTAQGRSDEEIAEAIAKIQPEEDAEPQECNTRPGVIGDLKQGDVIIVKSDQDLTSAKEITATEIILDCF